jgi:hypothetical protein
MCPPTCSPDRCSEKPQAGKPWATSRFRHSVFTQHPPAHGPSKKLFARQLTVGSLMRYRDRAQMLIRERLAELAGIGRFALRQDFAEPVVTQFWSYVLGLSYDEVAHVSELAVRLRRANEFNLTAEDRRDINNAGNSVLTDFNQLLRRGIEGGQVEFLQDLRADFCAMGDIGRPDSLPAVETVAYFIVAESLTNAAKHTPGARVEIGLDERGGDLFVEITDFGPGGANPSGSGLTGLTGLGQRAEALDGTLRITSPPGVGTQVEAVLPCEW